MRIVIAGPVSPSALSEYLHGRDAVIASQHTASHGTPVGALARGLLSRGHELVVVTHRRGAPGLTLRGERVEFFQIESRSSVVAQGLSQFRQERARMVEVIAAAKADLVHAHWTYEWALAALATPLPVLVTVHDAPLEVIRQNKGAYWYFRALMAARVRLAMRPSDAFSAVSPYIAELWKRESHWRGPVQIVPNVLNRVESKYTSQRCGFVEVADASARKNVRTLLEAFKLVRAHSHTAKLTLIGVGLGERDDMFRWAREHELHDGVDFLGAKTHAETLEVIDRSAVHVHASLEESFGMTVAESMSLGVPVVVGRGTGAAEWMLGEDPGGILMDPRNPDSIAAAMIALDSSPARAKELGAAGAARFNALLDPEHVLDQYVDLYRNVIDDSNRTPWRSE